MVEGAPLLREYGLKKSIEGSNPSLSARIESNEVRQYPQEPVVYMVDNGFFVLAHNGIVPSSCGTDFDLYHKILIINNNYFISVGSRRH